MRSHLALKLLLSAMVWITSPARAEDLDAIASEEAQRVDNYYRAHNELQKDRGSSSIHKADQCPGDLQNKTSFSDRIVYFVNLHMNEMLISLNGLQSYFNLPKQVENFKKVSLITQPLCEPNLNNLKQDIKKVPSNSVMKQLTEMVKVLNQNRLLAIKGDPEPAIRSWSKLMMCLAYVESLSSADSNSSERVAEKNLPTEIRRPDGVLFYEDPYQDATSRLNIGLYQFTPNASGNIQPCLFEWNRNFPKCAIAKNSSNTALAVLLGSTHQSFNGFCGVNKILQSFSVQVNTTAKQNTSAANLKKDGTLVSQENRCVSLQMAAGKAYNHFGPLQNSTGDNLNELVTCFIKAN